MLLRSGKVWTSVGLLNPDSIDPLASLELQWTTGVHWCRPIKVGTYCRVARGKEVVMPKWFLFQSPFRRIAEWIFPGVWGGISECHVVLLERQDTPNTTPSESSITNETSTVLGTNQTTHTGLFENRVPPKYTGYPLVNIQKAIENGPVEIVDFPIKNGWIFPLLC